MPEIRESSPAALPEHTSCDVAIVGYGPVGMIFAALLAQLGLKVVVVERFATRYNLPRAGHLDGETMRGAFQRLGIAEAIELIARPMLSYELVTPQGEVLQQVKLGAAGSGWKESYLFYQPELETIVDARGAELGVRVYMSMTAERIEQSAGRVVLTVRSTDKPGEAAHRIEAAYVIGADGARSFVREAIGVGRQDLGYPAIDNLVLDFEQNDPDRDLPLLGEVRQILDVNRPTHVGRWSGQRWSRLEFRRMEGETREFLESEETAWKFLAQYGLLPEHGRIVRRAIHTFESSITERWRVGRVLLVGDAAHTMPPFMGQGMCSGVRDALNLSWKLAAILGGKTSDAILDSYQTERAPHVKDVIAMSMEVGDNVQVTDPELGRQRDEALRAGKTAPPALFPRLGSGIVRRSDHPDAIDAEGRPALQARVALGARVDRLDQFQKAGWRILARHTVPDTLFNARQRALLSVLDMEIAHISRGAGADHFVDIDAEYDLWFRTTGRKVFVLRPDNYVFGSARTIGELPALLDELAGCLASSGWIAASVKS
jgi:2-polyprenyl-6-methoxyphenol hydroxylase-like FAD-dependent oxidoreductase